MVIAPGLHPPYLVVKRLFALEEAPSSLKQQSTGNSAQDPVSEATSSAVLKVTLLPILSQLDKKPDDPVLCCL